MSDEWSVVSDEMVSRESPPRILKELQDITTQILQEFSSSGEPITDDNHVLHRLCVKLEYLLQTCMREKTILGGNKHYWHWMYDSLKRTKRLSDGLRFVLSNKEVRTSQGKGRALIRYSLVHQTLADSFQNCLMNQSTCTHFLKPTCILARPALTAYFLNALYEINAVNFDLISKGYDLDTAWPTFASKRYHPGLEQWRLPGDRTTSLGSLGSYVSHITSASMVGEPVRGLRNPSGIMDMDGRGTVSSGPPSVDQRVEELVLELNESDQKIHEQEEALKRLEDAASSATEKQDILARVISDLESRNQGIQDAMSQMTTEFQHREKSWEIKYNQSQTSLQETEELNCHLKQKIEVLEGDKRNLEDTVSARMTRITSGFSGTDANSISPAMSLDDIDAESQNIELREQLDKSEWDRKNLEESIESLRMEISSFPRKMKTEKTALELSMTAKFESQEMEWKRKVDNALESATDSVLTQLANVLPAEFFTAVVEAQSSQEKVNEVATKLNIVVGEVARLQNASSKLEEETLLHQSYGKEQEQETRELVEKLKTMEQERDNILEELKDVSNQLITLNEELQNMKLSHEAEISNQQRDMLELKDANFHLEESTKKEQFTNKELSEELHHLKERYTDTSVELKGFRQRCVDLEEQLVGRLQSDESAPSSDSDGNQSKAILDYEAKIADLERQAEEEGKLQEVCIQENERLDSLVNELTAKDEESAATIEELGKRIENLNSTLESSEQEKAALAAELSVEKTKMLEQFQRNSDILSSLATMSEAFKNTEEQHQKLTENLGSTDFQMNAIKACIEAERSLAKNHYDELSGENESRKRMIASMETKMETLQEENSKLSKNACDAKELENLLLQTREEKTEMAVSSHAIEQECIKVAEKLEQERTKATKLRSEVDDGLKREQVLKQEIDDMQTVSNELKTRLVQLLKEKDALWKECDELKFSQKLQEEGDETESKWMADQEARYCLHCGTEFSFITRKHHCRICGKIFCNNCSKQWIITRDDGKHERCCLPCLEKHRSAKEAEALAASQQSSPIKGNRLAIDDSEFESITNEEVDESKEDDDSQPSISSADQSSLYLTPNAKSGGDSRDSISSFSHDESNSNYDGEDTDALVTAGDVLKVPVNIRTPGSSLFWRFSSDRSIDFQLSYRPTEDAVDEQPLIPKCRCNSHSEPVQGDMLAKVSGIYTFELDNQFSRFTSKAVKYSLKLKDPESD